MRRLSRLGSALAVALLCGPTDASSQLTDQQPAQQPAPNSSPLERPVTLRLRRVALETALREIERQAGVSLLYSRTFVPLKKLVSVEGTDIAVREALRLALHGTGIVAVMGSGGAIVLEEAREERNRKRRAGGIVGRVTDATTGAGIAAAEVLLDGTRWRTATDTAGRYRLVGIDSGRLHVDGAADRLCEADQGGHGRGGARGHGGRGAGAAADQARRVGDHRDRPAAAAGARQRRDRPRRRLDRAHPADQERDRAPGSAGPGPAVQRTSGAPGDPSRLRSGERRARC